MKSLNLNEIIRFLCPLLSLNDARRVCRVLVRIRLPASGRFRSEQMISLGLMTGVSWLTVRSRKHIVLNGLSLNRGNYS